MIKKILTSAIGKNASWLIGGKVAQMMISLVIGVLTTRFLGPANYGLINYAGAYTGFFASLCQLGINSFLVKELIDHPNAEGMVLGTGLFLRIISSALSSVMIVCIVSVVDAGEPITIVVVALSTIGVIFNAFDVFYYWYQSKLRSKIPAIATFIAYVITSVYRVILMIMGKSVLYFAFATSVDYICYASILVLFYYKHGGKKLTFSWQYGKQLLGKSYHFILSGLMVAIYTQTDKVMLKHMLSETTLGYYSTAATICAMWCFVLTAIIDSMYPSIMQANGKDDALFNQRNKLLYAIVFYVSAAVSIVFVIAAPLIIRILYGEAFMPAANPLRILTWNTAFAYLGVARNAWLVCRNKQKYMKYLYIAAAILNVGLNLFFIPRYGASGAAIATVLSQVSTSILLPFCTKPLRENSIMVLQAIALKGIKKVDL